MQVEENLFIDTYDRRRLYDDDDDDVIVDKAEVMDKGRKKLMRSSATTDDDDEYDDPLTSQDIEPLTSPDIKEPKVRISTSHDGEEEERSSNESLSRSSSVSSSTSSADDRRGERRGVLRGKNLKRKSSAQTPNSDHDPGYDTMLAGTNFDDWIGTSSGPEDEVPVVKKVVFRKTASIIEPVEEPSVEYTKGMMCSDVKTALTILRTRYSLRNIQVSKPPYAGRGFMDIHKTMTNGYRPPTEGSPSVGLYAPKQNPYYATEPLKEITKKIFIRDLEIKEILAKIMAADDQQRRLEADLLKPKLFCWDEKMDEYDTRGDSTPVGKSRKQTSFSPVVQVERQRPQSEGAQRQSAGDDEENVPKKRKRNVFQRAAHALRKRITSG